MNYNTHSKQQQTSNKRDSKTPKRRISPLRRLLDNEFPFQIYWSLVKKPTCPIQRQLYVPVDFNFGSSRRAYSRRRDKWIDGLNEGGFTDFNGSGFKRLTKKNYESYIQELETKARESKNYRNRARLEQELNRLVELRYYVQRCLSGTQLLSSLQAKQDSKGNTRKEKVIRSRQIDKLRNKNKSVLYGLSTNMADQNGRKIKDRDPFLVKLKDRFQNLKGFEKRANVYFYPNLLKEVWRHNRGFGKVYDGADKLKVDTLHFLFAELDNKGEQKDVDISERLCWLPDSFPMPDVVIETSPFAYHCYWSIKPIQIGDKEGYNGRVSDHSLIKWQFVSDFLEDYLKGDPRNPVSQMRVPGMSSIKPNRRRGFLVRYVKNSRTLTDAKANPQYDLDELLVIVDKLGWLEARNSQEFKKSGVAYTEKVANRLGIKVNTSSNTVPDLNLLRGQEESPESKCPSGQLETISQAKFIEGWEAFVSSVEALIRRNLEDNSLYKLQLKRTLRSPELSEDECKVLKYIWANRSHRNGVVFSHEFTKSLSERGHGYNRLNKLVQNLEARLGPIIGVKLFTVSKPNPSKGIARRFKVADELWSLLGIDVYKSDGMGTPAFRYDYYSDDERNKGVYIDAKDMFRSGYNKEQILERVRFKVLNAQNFTDGCSPRTDDIEAKVDRAIEDVKAEAV